MSLVKFKDGSGHTGNCEEPDHGYPCGSCRGCEWDNRHDEPHVVEWLPPRGALAKRRRILSEVGWNWKLALVGTSWVWTAECGCCGAVFEHQERPEREPLLAPERPVGLFPEPAPGDGVGTCRFCGVAIDSSGAMVPE